jgi:hypothetical protein
MIVDGDRPLQRFALVHRVSEPRINYSQIVVSDSIRWVDRDCFVQLLNRVCQILLAHQLIRFLKFFAGTAGNSEIG